MSGRDANPRLRSGPADLPSIGIILHDFALGGTERIAVRLANAWTRAGACVTVFCGSGEGPMRALLDPAVAVIVADPPIVRGWGSRRRLGRAAAEAFATRPPAICFVPGNWHWAVAPALTCLPTAVIAQVSNALAKPQRGRLRQLLFEMRMRRELGRVAAIVALSDDAAEQARRIVPNKPVEIIALPALDDDVAPPLPIPPGGPILAVGRLVPEKGFDLLVEALARVGKPAGLVILGEGPERARLAALIAARGLSERASLPGYAADARPWLDRARLFVLPSRFEGYPAVLVEALAAGRPAVATACTAAAALAERVVPIDDVAALAGAIDAMLAASPPDPAELAARVTHHRIGPVAWAYLDLFARAAR